MNGSATVSGTVYGGYTNVANGKATGNEVTLEKTIMGSVVGSSGTITNDNIINLRNAAVSGTVTGGTAANGTGNTLAVYYGTGTTSIGNVSGIQNLHFNLENAPTSNTNPLLKITNAAAEKSLSNINLAVHRSGATQKLEKGDTFTLVENTTAGGSIGIGDNVTAEGTDGVSRNYTYDIRKDAAVAHVLDELDPIACLLIEVADATCRALDARKESNALVVAQGVRRNALFLADFLNGHEIRPFVLFF